MQSTTGPLGGALGGWPMTQGMMQPIQDQMQQTKLAQMGAGSALPGLGPLGGALGGALGGVTASQSSPTTMQLPGIAGVDFKPGGFGTGAVFNTGLTTGYDTLNNIHQQSAIDFNDILARSPWLQEAGVQQLDPTTNIDLTGQGVVGFGDSHDAMSDPFGLGSSGGASGGSRRNASQGYQINPMVQQIIDGMVAQSGDALGQGLSQIDGNYVGVGGLGGSRYALAQANAIEGSQDALQRNIANAMFGAYENQQNRDLQKYGIDTGAATSRYGIDANTNLGLTNAQNNYNLGVGQLQLGNRNTDISAVNSAASLWNLGTQGALGQGQGLFGLGTAQQSAPWANLQNAVGAIRPFTGLGQTQTSTENAGAQGILGGMLGGAQLGGIMWPNSAPPYAPEAYRTTGNGMPSWYGG